MGEVRQQAIEFLELVNKLKSSGNKKHEISSILNLHSPVLSSLCRTVFPFIINPKEELDSEDAIINLAFEKVNNLSKDKTLRNLPLYIEYLREIPKDKRIEQSKDPLDPYKNSIAASYNSMRGTFPGIYECYTHSTNIKAVKCEPFLIRDNHSKQYIEIKKGNHNTEHSFEGYAFLSGSHLISIYLTDSPNNTMETGLIQLIQPFTKSFDILRGLYLNLSISKTPIARRIVLQKIGSECSIDQFNELLTKRFQIGEDTAELNPEIMAYLNEPDDLIECIQLPHPTFKVQDLKREKELIKNLSSEL